MRTVTRNGYLRNKKNGWYLTDTHQIIDGETYYVINDDKNARSLLIRRSVLRGLKDHRGIEFE